MAKSISGTNGSMGAGSSPVRSSSQPHWKTMTRMPKAAPIDSRFITTAFSGTSSDRNTAISSRNERPRTTPKNSGSRDGEEVGEVDLDRDLAGDLHVEAGAGGGGGQRRRRGGG